MGWIVADAISKVDLRRMDARQSDPQIIERFDGVFAQPISILAVSSLPPRVYHYTTAAGFAGILKDGAIRATNFSFLNDPSEIQYGRELADSELQKRQKSASSIGQQFLSLVAERLHAALLSEVYVCCFTSLADDLGQWRAYASAAVERYALGFDSDLLHETAWKLDNSVFARVIYDEPEQLERLSFIMDTASAFVEDAHPSQADLESLAENAAARIARVLPVLKSPAYSREEEWRIILWQDREDHIPEFDASRGFLRPFLKVVLPAPLPLVHLYVMAPTRREAALKAAEMLLRVTRVSDIRLDHSRVPFAE